MIAAVRPHGWDFPLFLHVFGAMTLFGIVLAALIVSVAGLPRAAFSSLAAALPAWAVALIGAYWIQGDEHLSRSNATWLGIGHGVLEPGLIVLLAALGAAFWWRRSGKALAGRFAAGLSALYLILLAVAWLAMSGKWS